MPLKFFLFLLLFQQKKALCFLNPFLPALFFSFRFVLLILQLQGLLSLCPDTGSLCLLSDSPGSAFRVIRRLAGVCLYSRTENQLIIVLKDKIPNLIVFRFRSKSNFADRQFPVTDTFKDACPEWIFEKYSQTCFHIL